MFENCTLRYNQFITGTNDSVIITYPANENGVSKTVCVPIDENNADYAAILEWAKEDSNEIDAAD